MDVDRTMDDVTKKLMTTVKAARNTERQLEAAMTAIVTAVTELESPPVCCNKTNPDSPHRQL